MTASNALFIKNRPRYFFIITDFIIFITDNTLLYYKPLVGDYVAKIVIPTERSDEGSLKLHERDISHMVDMTLSRRLSSRQSVATKL